MASVQAQEDRSGLLSGPVLSPPPVLSFQGKAKVAEPFQVKTGPATFAFPFGRSTGIFWVIGIKKAIILTRQQPAPQARV
jgi:hypothetical protein